MNNILVCNDDISTAAVTMPLALGRWI